jgi:hypothetical protein
MEPMGDARSAARTVADWAASGAMALTGQAGASALGPPAPLVPRLEAIAGVLRERTTTMGHMVDVQPLPLLADRAAYTGLGRQGTISCGGSSRLLPTADGWIAVSLARPEDVELVPAWLELPAAPTDVWTAVAEQVASRRTSPLVDRAGLVGLPVGGLPRGGRHLRSNRGPGSPLHPALPVRAERIGATTATPMSLPDARVVDLSSLWAGPLCGGLLAAGGADVVKVEALDRPDGARLGPVGFFDLLNAGKRSVALDLRADAGRRQLVALISRADVVIEASRPRALTQMGIDPHRALTGAGPSVWVSITGHGRRAGHRVGFGDDAAVAGGLVSWDGDGPCFCADAIADPISGLTAAAAAVEALASGGRWLVDVAMAGVARSLAGPTIPVRPGTTARPPRRRAVHARAPLLGEHTEEVLATVSP